jgi:hypothetical protein
MRELRVLIFVSLLTGLFTVLGSAVGTAWAGGTAPSAPGGSGTTPTVLTVHAARQLCFLAPLPHGRHVTVDGFEVPRVPLTGAASTMGIGALFGRREPISTAHVSPWPPSGGLAFSWNNFVKAVPGVIGYPNFRWVAMTGFLNCMGGAHPWLRIQAVRLWSRHP